MEKRDEIDIVEIFTSVDGEVNGYNGQGQISTFIRLHKCNLACHYCDTEYARRADAPALRYTFGALLDRVMRAGPTKVTFTGGEPLLQMDAIVEFLSEWLPDYFQVTFETNGSVDFTPVQEFGIIVADYKLPSSGMEEHMQTKYWQKLRKQDWLKFVIGGKDDFKRAEEIVKHQLVAPCHVAFSPVTPGMGAKDLLGLMLDNKLYDVHLNVQLHKLLEVK